MQGKIKKETLFFIFISILAFIWLIPVLFMLLTSLKAPTDLYANPILALPDEFQWKNFAEAWSAGNMSTYMRNSALISIVKVPLGIFVAALASFGLSRLNFKFSQSGFVFFVIGMTVPFQAALVPLVILLNNLNLLNTLTGLIIAYIGFGLPMAILVLTSFMKGIPKEMDEAAKIDGCSTWQLFTKVTLPVIKPAISTLIILDFLATWNEFLLAQTFINSDRFRTVPAGLLQFQGQHSTNYPLMMAGVFISVLPVLIVYLIFQKHFVSGFGGAVKG